jgi:hypothetical protein
MRGNASPTLQHEHVAEPAHGLEQARVLGIVAQLGAQARDLYVDRAVEALLGVAFRQVQQLLATEHAPCVFSEHPQQRELVRRERELVAG